MEWKTIKYNDKYEVSDTGLVRTKKTGHIHSGCIAQGYLSVKLTFENSRQKRFKIHRLVAEHFIENPDPKKKTFVNHIDGNKLNNNKENLEWVTPSENQIHSRDALHRRYHSRPVICIETGERFNSIVQASKLTNTPMGNLCSCCTGNRERAGGYHWRYADE